MSEPLTLPHPRSFEEIMAILTLGISTLEKLQAIGPTQHDRVRQATIRLANCERRFSREVG